MTAAGVIKATPLSTPYQTGEQSLISEDWVIPVMNVDSLSLPGSQEQYNDLNVRLRWLAGVIHASLLLLG